MNTQLILVGLAGLSLIGMIVWMWDWKRFVFCLFTAIISVGAFFFML